MPGLPTVRVVVGFQKSDTPADQRRSAAPWRSGKVTAVSLRLLYLIFQQVLSLVLLMGRTASSKARLLPSLEASGNGFGTAQPGSARPVP